MQSFSYKAKAELCRGTVQRLCCARAECYGALLYCNTFTMQEVRIITENPEFAARLPRLFQRAFNVKFDRLPSDDLPGGKRKRLTLFLAACGGEPRLDEGECVSGVWLDARRARERLPAWYGEALERAERLLRSTQGNR